jgi:transposase
LAAPVRGGGCIVAMPSEMNLPPSPDARKRYFHCSLEIPMQHITRRRYTDDFKAQAILLAESIGPAKAARQLDMSVKTLSNWLDASRAGRPLSSPSRKPVSELESELARLRAENATLKMERDILKKATAFFARESK